MSSSANERNQPAKNIDEEDRISDLHEAIQSHILNFLPTKDAVRTSVLSLSWKNKWKLINSVDMHDFLTDLDREENKDERAHSFIMFVNKVLTQISTPTICKFKLQLSERMYDPNDLTVLFSDVVERQIQELDISCANDIPRFPAKVFNCISLVKLVLEMDYCTIRVESPIFLPSLQTLVLAGVQLQVVQDHLPRSVELVLNLPMLRSFECYRCDSFRVTDISINAPMLETFTMESSCFKFEHFDDELDEHDDEHDDHDDELDDQDDGLDDFDDELMSFGITINAPNLRVFSYEFFSDENIIFPYSSSIQEAHIGAEVLGNMVEADLTDISAKTDMLLKALNGVEYLELHFFNRFETHRILDLLNHVNDNSTTTPAFKRLLQLELTLPRCLISQKILLNFIQISPVLQKLVINYAMTKFDNQLLIVEEVPQCFLHTLEVVEFVVPEVDGIIIGLAKFVLQYSRVLKLMTIDLCLKVPDVIEQVNQVLLLSPRASDIATIRVE